MRSKPARKPLAYPVAELVERLEAVYGKSEREEPLNPVDELVACILSQHTSDSNSIPAFHRLKEAFPTWDQAVAAGPERIAALVKRAGLANQKSHSIVRSLEAIKDRVGTRSLEHLRSMPMIEAREWLSSLPGVGPKTASIVLCFSLGMGAIPVDTHVYRVSWRLGLIPEGIGEAKAHDLLLELVPEELAFPFHMALIQHGRQTCKAPVPLCEKCPMTDLCRWYKAGGPATREAEIRSKRMTA